MGTVEERTKQVIAENMGLSVEDLTIDTQFIRDLNMDSLDTVEAIMDLEDEFNLTIPDADAERILSVGQAVDWITQHKKD